jgi:hypothetical protein
VNAKTGKSIKGSRGLVPFIDKNTVVIFDEAHAMQNSAEDGNWASQLAEMSNNAGRVLFMTATPTDQPHRIQYMSRVGTLEGKTAAQQYQDLGFKMIRPKVKPGEEPAAPRWAVDRKIGLKQVRYKTSLAITQQDQKKNHRPGMVQNQAVY